MTKRKSKKVNKVASKIENCSSNSKSKTGHIKKNNTSTSLMDGIRNWLLPVFIGAPGFLVAAKEIVDWFTKFM